MATDLVENDGCNVESTQSAFSQMGKGGEMIVQNGRHQMAEEKVPILIRLV